MNILLTISYDGTNYCGWQRQHNGIAVQEKVEYALSEVFGQQKTITGASRTDAGVHALGQRASFFTDDCKIPLEKLPSVINAQLPPDIVVTNAAAVSEDFHPRFGAKLKLYEYAVYNSRYLSPLVRNYAWHVPYPLNLEKMRSAAERFIGEHDFAAFCASGGSARTSVRVIYELNIAKNGDIIKIAIKGGGFLYNMARIITGTLVYVGSGKIQPDDIENILRSRDRALAGKTAPPQGLTLVEIRY